MKLKNYINYISLIAILAFSLLSITPAQAGAAAVTNDKTVKSIKEIILLTKPQCVFKSSNEQGRVSGGQIGELVQTKYETINCYNGLNTYAKVQFVGGAGVNRDTVIGYVNTKEIIIYSALLKPSAKSISMAGFNKNLYVKPDCNFTKGSANDKAFVLSSLPIKIGGGNTIGDPISITCPNGPTVFYKVQFGYATTVEFHEYNEGTTAYVRSIDLPRSFSSYTKPLYNYPACTFTKGNKNDAGAGKLAINGNVLGAVILTCSGTAKTFYKVSYNYTTKLESHEGYIAYMLSTDY